MAAFDLLGVVAGFMFLLYSLGFHLGAHGFVLARWLYALGVPAAIAAIGGWITSNADPGRPGDLATEALVAFVLTAFLTVVTFVANGIRVLRGLAQARRPQPRHRHVQSASSAM